MTLDYKEMIKVMAWAIAKRYHHKRSNARHHADGYAEDHWEEFEMEAKDAFKAFQGEMPDIVKNSKLPDEIYINEGSEAIIIYNELKNLKE